MYDSEAARAAFLEVGCSTEEADTLVDAGIEPDVVGTGARDAVGFASAANFHGLDDANRYLEDAQGDPEKAWEAWGKDSGEWPWSQGEDEDDAVQGWMSAYIGSDGPGEYVIDLYDDLGMPGNASYVTALRFSVPVVAGTSPGEQDALVVRAATERLVAHGCILDSDVSGSGDSFRARVCTSDSAAEWLEERRTPAEKYDLLVTGLRALLDDASAGRPGGDGLRVDIAPDPRPGRPDAAPEGDADTGTRTPPVEWTDRDAFLETVAARRSGRVVVTRYQGGWAERIEGAEDIEHPALDGLEPVRAEAARRDGEPSGFTAEFRSGTEIHRHRFEAEWVPELDERLRGWEREVSTVRDEQARFPRLEQWGQELCRALLEDERFLAAPKTADQNRRGAALARRMFGADCPVRSVYIRRALVEARTKRAEVLLERRRAQWRTVVPEWAVRLAASADFRQGSTAERAMLASNLLYAHDPEADTPELVRLLRTEATDLLTGQKPERHRPE
jgi:hypothetical protein